MYAVIETGGKQYRVEPGQRLDVERLRADDEQVVFSPILLVDGDDVLATPGQLEGSTVQARLVGETKGPKIEGFTYKNKTNQRRRWGHRQKLATVEIVRIARG
jgi:large subunit ribosomal protein L21